MVEDPKTGKISSKVTPRFIALGHELVHAEAIMDGNSSDNKGQHFFYDENGKQQWENFELEEYRTTGFSGFPRLKGNYPTENQLREENGIGKRVAYGPGWTDYQKKKYGY